MSSFKSCCFAFVLHANIGVKHQLLVAAARAAQSALRAHVGGRLQPMKRPYVLASMSCKKQLAEEVLLASPSYSNTDH